ncbi:hypothetical protein C2G38_2227435 [Gigaspora rosea]|uniref:Uncharacterized protein n=1 Tax=Gigaspora rosea TaxID=44941 RepID=A0A397U6A2_9GLOM|nr:hypothetical protein C2G38_2227435 [Gigaspora rosea]
MINFFFNFLDISGTLNKILNKLDDLSEKINQMDRRLAEVEERMSESFNLAHENNFIQQMVKATAKILIETTIYPSEEEYKEAAEEYLLEHQSKYFESLSDKRWATYYKQNIAGPWKASEKIKSCYKKLFTPIFSDPADTYMARILGKIWSTTISSDIKVAYTITVCQVTLSQHYEKFTMREDIMKNRLIKNLHKLQKREKFLPPASDEETSEEKVEEVREGRKK